MRLWPFAKKALTDEEILDLVGGGVQTSSGITVSSDTALRVPAVAAAVRTISEAAASLRRNVVEIAEDRSETVVTSHPVVPLICDEANEWTSSFELVRALVIDALTRDAGGMAWVNWIGGETREIIRYRSGIIGVEYDKDGTGEPSYRINGRPVDRRQIIHLRSTFERCPVTLCREAIGAAVAMEQHASRLFGRGARPSGIIKTKKNVGDTGVTRMLAGWRAAHEGAGNSGKTAVLWDDAQWEQMQLSSVDAQFQQLRTFQLQEIARAFNIPPILLGELGRATWSNSAEMQRMFLLLCLEPWLLAIEGALRRALFTNDDRKRFAVRIERDDFSKVDLAVLATAISSLVSGRVINPNTAREWLDLPPYDAGDEYANPNTGASQPGGAPPAQSNDEDKEDDDDADSE
jgi:HK97 family phage portal protein